MTPAFNRTIARACIRRLLRDTPKNDPDAWIDIPVGPSRSRRITRAAVMRVATRMHTRTIAICLLCVEQRVSRAEAARRLGIGPATVSRALADFYAAVLYALLDIR